MRASSWTLWVKTPGGQPVTIVTAFSELDAMVVANDVGDLTFTLAASRFSPSLFKEDAILELYGETGLFCGRFWRVSEVSDVYGPSGGRLFSVSARCSNSILADHIVAYASETSQSLKTTGAAAMMRQFIDENIGPGATDMFSDDRDMSAVVEIATLNWTSPTITDYEGSTRNLLKVCQDIASASLALGTFLAFDVTRIPGTPYRARIGIYRDQIGVNHGQYSNGAVILSMKRGTLSETEAVSSYGGVKNVVYVGGSGRGAERPYVSVYDLASVKRGIYGRSELFAGRSSQDLTSLTDEARAELERARAKRTFAATFNQTPQAVFGKHFRFGDIVAVSSIGGEMIDMHVNGARLRLAGGEARIDLAMREA